MKSFEYAAPKTVKEATALLSDKWGETEVLAGGTDLITSLKQEIAAPKRVVSLKNIPELRGIKLEKGAAHIGASGSQCLGTPSQSCAGPPASLHSASI